MRLLFLTNLYPPHDLGGFEQWCQEVADGLRGRGHAVHILTSRHGLGSPADAGAITSGNHEGIAPTWSPEDGVTRTLNLQADIHHYSPADFFLKRRTQEDQNRDELREAIERLHPDLVVVWGMWNLSRWLPYWAEQWMPGRVAYYMASYWPTDPDMHEEYWRLPAGHGAAEIVKGPLRALAMAQLRRENYPPPLRFEQVMCCSHFVRDSLVKAGKLPPGAGVLLGGIDPAPFLANPARAAAVRGLPQRNIPATEASTPLKLLYFGSLLPHKGVHTAIEALGVLRQRGIADFLHLTLLGGGHPDYEARLRSLVEQYGLTDKVCFAGRAPRAEIPSRLPQFDVFLFTSTWPEPFGRTIVEAMAAGLVVIGADVGGSREIFEHYSDELLFPPENPTELASRIERILSEPGSLSDLAQAGRQLVLERFTLDRMVDDMESWLREIAQG